MICLIQRIWSNFCSKFDQSVKIIYIFVIFYLLLPHVFFRVHIGLLIICIVSEYNRECLQHVSPRFMIRSYMKFCFVRTNFVYCTNASLSLGTLLNNIIMLMAWWKVCRTTVSSKIYCSEEVYCARVSNHTWSFLYMPILTIYYIVCL